jgi:hypothetical protein
MISERVYTRIRANNYIADKDKALIYKLFDVSNQITFGKIDSRREGYKYQGIGNPRCTAILQMDGSRAAALMEWAKREVADYIDKTLVYKLLNGEPITEWIIDEVCKDGYHNPDKQKMTAAWQGTKAHDNAENWLNGNKFEQDALLNTFIRVWQDEAVELVATEIPLVWRSRGLGFGGKCDILAYKDGKFILYDNKTSRSIHESYALQVAAYKEALEQMSPGLKISECKIIHLADTNNMSDWQKKQYNKLGNLIKIRNLAKAWKHYKVLLEQYEMRNNKYF